jgi:hypothetical protein
MLTSCKSRNKPRTGFAMRRSQIWILKLVPAFAYGGWLTAALLFSLLYYTFSLGNDGVGTEDTPALFFSLIIAYIIPVFSFITARAEEALLELTPLLPADSNTPQSPQDTLRKVSLRILLLLSVGGTLMGLGHLLFIRGSIAQMLRELQSGPADLLSTLGTILVWVVMFTVIYMLVQQAIMFARLGAKLKISLLNTHALLPFGRVSTYSSLAILGALAMFPLINLDGQFELAEGLPGAVATIVPLIMIFFIPVWPIHKRVSALKAEALTALTAKLEACLGDDDDRHPPREKIPELSALLAYRREVSQVSTWPFDLSSMTRLSLYLVIVPLTWAGAALIERLVDLIV